MNPRVHEAIAAAAVRAQDEWVVEIGAGLGTLTARLAAATPRGRVVAVERDRDLAQVLRAELGVLPNVEIAEANALTFDYAAVARQAGKSIVIAGNLPYQIASQLLFAVLAARSHLARAVVMLQREMADRLLAAPGTPEYGALGVMVAAHAKVMRVVRVSAGSFHPRPRVDSTVVAIDPLPEGSLVPAGLETRFSQVVHAAFGQRRKTLRNALRAVFGGESVDRVLHAAGVAGERRGETLAIDEFVRLAAASDPQVAT